MAVVYNTDAGTGSFTGTTTTTFGLTLPGTPANGDVLLCALSLQSNTTQVTVAFSTGSWLLLGNAVSALSTSGTMTAVYVRRWATGDPITWTVTLGANRLVAASVRAYTGVSTDNFLDWGVLTAVGTAVTSLAVTARTLSAGALLVGACGTSGTVAITPPAEATETQELVSGTYRSETTEEAPAVGGGMSRTWTFASCNAALVLVALRPTGVPAARSWYVRPDGSDANAGTGAATADAWATLGRALGVGSPVQPRDTVYVAPGTYRETVTAGTLDLGPAGAGTLEVQGDPECERFADLYGGPVVWSAYTAGDQAAPATAACYNAGGRSNLLFEALDFVGGNPSAGASCWNGGSAQYGVTLQRCRFTGGKQAAQAQVDLYTLLLTSASASDHWIDACVFEVPISGTGLQVLCAAAAGGPDRDANVDVRNCLFVGGSIGLGVAINGSGTFRTGGVHVRSCTFWKEGTAVNVVAGATSYHYPVRCANNFVSDCSTGFTTSSGTALLVEEFNLNTAATPRNTVSGGASDVTGLAYNRAVASGQDLVTGRRPRPLASPLPGSALLGWGKNGLLVGGPSAAVDEASLGTIAWGGPTSALQADSVRATAVAVPAATGLTHYLVLTGFNLSGVYSGDTILGVRVEVLASASATSSIRFNAVRLVKGGVISGDDKFAENVANLTTSDVLYGFGAHNALWGLTLTRDDVVASDFGVAVSMKNIHATVAADARIDFVKLTVTIAQGAYEVGFDGQNVRRPAGGQVLPAVGAYECGNTLTPDPAVYHTAAPAGRLTGPGYQDFDVPVGAGAQTVRVWAYKQTGFAGSPPQLVVLNSRALAVVEAPSTLVDAADGADATWQQLGVPLTVGRPGVLRVRLLSEATSAASVVTFDDFGVVPG